MVECKRARKNGLGIICIPFADLQETIRSTRAGTWPVLHTPSSGIVCGTQEWPEVKTLQVRLTS